MGMCGVEPGNHAQRGGSRTWGSWADGGVELQQPLCIIGVRIVGWRMMLQRPQQAAFLQHIEDAAHQTNKLARVAQGGLQLPPEQGARDSDTFEVHGWNLANVSKCARFINPALPPCAPPYG